jgi:hypothetical protein
MVSTAIGNSTGAIALSARLTPATSRSDIGIENTESFEYAVYIDHRPILLCRVSSENMESESGAFLYARELDKLDSNSCIPTKGLDVVPVDALDIEPSFD